MPRLLKLIVAVVLLVVLMSQMDWKALPGYLSRIDWSVGGLALLVIALALPVNASKWLWALRLHDLSFPWMYLFRVSCIAYFFSNFMPSAIGGDVYRIYRTWPQAEAKSRAVSAVLVERIVGLTVMLCNGAIGAMFLMDTHELARSYLLVTAVGVIVTLIVGVATFFGALQPLRAALQRFPKLCAIEENVRRIARARPEWGALLATSFVFQLLAAMLVYLPFLGVGAEISIGAAFLMTAAAGMASVLPISISGLGVVEGAIAASAVALGVSYELAVMAAIIIRLLVLLISALCGLFYLLDDRAAAEVKAARAEP